MELRHNLSLRHMGILAQYENSAIEINMDFSQEEMD